MKPETEKPDSERRPELPKEAAPLYVWLLTAGLLAVAAVIAIGVASMNAGR